MMAIVGAQILIAWSIASLIVIDYYQSGGGEDGED